MLGCLCAPWLANHDPAEFYLADRNTPPGSRFFFGTDSLGRDIYSIIWFGGRASLLIGLLSAAVITVLGVAYGCLSGIAPARTDALLMRLVELVQSIPVLLVLLLAVSLLGPQNALSIALLIGVTGWFALARIVRGEVRQIRHSEYILASRCMGGSFGWIMRRHLVPNVVSAILFVVISAVSTSIAMESTLSFLGLGLPVDELSWGSMLALARQGPAAQHLVGDPHPRPVPGDGPALHHEPGPPLPPQQRPGAPAISEHRQAPPAPDTCRPPGGIFVPPSAENLQPGPRARRRGTPP